MGFVADIISRRLPLVSRVARHAEPPRAAAQHHQPTTAKCEVFQLSFYTRTKPARASTARARDPSRYQIFWLASFSPLLVASTSSFACNQHTNTHTLTIALQSRRSNTGYLKRVALTTIKCVHSDCIQPICVYVPYTSTSILTNGTQRLVVYGRTAIQITGAQITTRCI